VAFLRGRLYGIHGTPFGTRFTHDRAIKEYKQALQLGGQPETIGYFLGKLYSAWDYHQEAIENYRKTVDILGVDDPLGIDAAQEIAKVEVKKKSGCFIATAAYGADSHHDVLVLSDFRDRFLMQYVIGRLFVKTYYLLSPPLAFIVKRSTFLAWFIRSTVLSPTSKIIRYFFYNQDNKSKGE
jgi:tetratricopeptide (TPR) repeat protein